MGPVSSSVAPPRLAVRTPPPVEAEEECGELEEFDDELEPLPRPQAPTKSEPAPKAERPLHRIREVRQIQGVTLRTVARHTRKETRTLRHEESPTTDLRVSDLLQWQQVLDVPLAELLVDDDAPLSRPVQERAQLLRIMKTAASILEKASAPGLKRLAQNLVDQLGEMMPELKEVSAWHSVGQRRSADELGRAADPRMSAIDVRFEAGE